MADLDSNRIAKAALELIDDAGFKGFSMRAVAKRLQVTPMALYHHVADKNALAGLVVEVVLKEMPLPEEKADWREDLLSLSKWMRKTTLTHPELAKLRRAHHIWHSSTLTLIDRWRNCWLRSGLPQDKALRASGASSLSVIGLVEEELNIREIPVPDPAVLEKVPNIRAIFASPEGQDANFELVVRSLIDGLYQNLGPASASV